MYDMRLQFEKKSLKKKEKRNFSQPRGGVRPVFQTFSKHAWNGLIHPENKYYFKEEIWFQSDIFCL